MKIYDVAQVLERLKLVRGESCDSSLAARIGITKSAICNWKKRNYLDIDVVVMFCETVCLDWLVLGRGPMRPVDVAAVAAAEKSAADAPARAEASVEALLETVRKQAETISALASALAARNA